VCYIQSVLERRYDSLSAMYHLLTVDRHKTSGASDGRSEALENMETDHVLNINAVSETRRVSLTSEEQLSLKV